MCACFFWSMLFFNQWLLWHTPDRTTFPKFGVISVIDAHQLMQMSACQCCSVFVFDEILFREARFTHIHVHVSAPEHRQDSDSEILQIRAAWHILPNCNRVTIISVHQRNVLLKRDYLRCDFTNVSVTELWTWLGSSLFSWVALSSSCTVAPIHLLRLSEVPSCAVMKCLRAQCWVPYCLCCIPKASFRSSTVLASVFMSS